MDYLQVATKNAESRLERLIQPGRETQRHLVAIIADLSLEKCSCRLQWMCRNVLDVHVVWKSAGKRKLQCREHNHAAWCVLLGAALQQCQVELEEAVEWVEETVQWYRSLEDDEEKQKAALEDLKKQ